MLKQPNLQGRRDDKECVVFFSGQRLAGEEAKRGGGRRTTGDRPAGNADFLSILEEPGDTEAVLELNRESCWCLSQSRSRW